VVCYVIKYWSSAAKIRERILLAFQRESIASRENSGLTVTLVKNPIVQDLFVEEGR
jgi:hypothetical protein